MIEVMIVDDEEDILNLYRFMFKKELNAQLIHFSCFTSPIKALENLKASKDNPPNLILSDINMPKMDGFTFLSEVKHTRCSAPVIMVSAYEDNAHIKKATSLGANNYITKPVAFSDLKKLIFKIAQNQIDNAK